MFGVILPENRILVDRHCIITAVMLDKTCHMRQQIPVNQGKIIKINTTIFK